MFITRFSRHGGSVEERMYKTEAGAQKRFELFLKDDSGIYRNICILDADTNTVLRVVVFDDPHPSIVYDVGDVVRLRPEFASEAERGLLFAIRNINEASERFEIACLNSGMSIPPSELVGFRMVYPVATTLQDILDAAEKKAT